MTFLDIENSENNYLFLLYNLKIDVICEEQRTTYMNIHTNYDLTIETSVIFSISNPIKRFFRPGNGIKIQLINA